MKIRSFLLMASLPIVCLLAFCPRPAVAFIMYTPPTLGNLCRQATHIYVLRVERVEKADAEKGSIVFKSVEQLKAQGVVVPDGTRAKHVVASDVKVGKPLGPNGAKVILDWAAEGKTAVLFAQATNQPKKKQGEPTPETDSGLKGHAHVYIDGYWYLASCDSSNSKVWVALYGEPIMLTRYCGPADKLGAAVAKILRGEEIVVPAMVGDNTRELEERRAKVQDLPASLKILNYDEQGKPVGESAYPGGKVTPIPGRLPSGKPVPGPSVWKPEAGDKKPDDKKPADKKPEGKKGEERQPGLVGTILALSDDGKRLTLLPAPTAKNKEPAAVDVQIGENAKITNGKEPGKLAVGQTVSVWLGKGDAKIAAMIQIGKPSDKPEKKPDEPKKPEDKKPIKKGEDRQPDRVGTVKAISADSRSFTLLPAPTLKNKEPAAIDIQIGEATKIVAGKEAGKLAIDQTVSVWLQMQKGGNSSVAVMIQIGKPPEPTEKKPAPPDKKPGKGTKPAADTPEKPEEPKKPKAPAKPARDPAPTATIIDAEVDRQLAKLKIPASPQADDAEFLRRVTLDLTGRIPTYSQTVAFLDSKDPNKRRKRIDELLDSPEYGEHLATIWRNLLVGRELNLTGKGGSNDTLRPWLAEQFNENRGWNAIVTDLLTAEGTPRDNPATAFLLANTENGQPRPNKVAGAAAALFWGANLRCAECHNHPFTHWKQTDFWGTAAFFGKVQYAGGKGEPASVTEALSGAAVPKQKGQTASVLRGTAIVIPAGGKSGGQVVKARFLGGDEPSLDEKEPFRPRFAAWATAADNPYFARAAANRLWGHFFGRGFVNPLDAFDERNPPSHPELLDRLAKELASSDFDLKHLARCITTSKAYQRTSRPVPGNEADTGAFSHMAVKALTPEVLFDALAVLGTGSGDGGKTSGAGKKGSGDKQESRDQFLRSFRFDEEATATDYIQGIPQLLRLMNASSVNRGTAVVDKLCRSTMSRTEAITTLYLTVLSRRPTPEEVELMSGYLSRRKDDREGYRGVVWILLNSSEFALNR